MARVQLGESRLRARRLRRRMVVAGFVAFICVACVGGLAALSWAPFMRISTVTIAEVRTADKEMLERAVWDELAGGYGFLFARSNIFLYPQQKITDTIESFSTIKTATVQAENFQTITVTVVERQPTALWCGDSVASPLGCYFLDENGLAYAPAALYSGDAYQKYYGPLQQVAAEENAHGQFLEQEQFHMLPALVESLAKTVQLPAIATSVAESDIQVMFEGGFVVRFGLTDDGGGVMERLSLALGAAPFTKHALSDFLYLDLRFGDKVYYKLKGQ